MLEKLAQEIVENCQPFLQQIDFNVSVNQLLRGMKPATGKYRHVTHANRIPRSTPLYIHQLNDDWFLQNHGHKFRNWTWPVSLDNSILYSLWVKYRTHGLPKLTICSNSTKTNYKTIQHKCQQKQAFASWGRFYPGC
jgi:hypothetical protein